MHLDAVTTCTELKTSVDTLAYRQRGTLSATRREIYLTGHRRSLQRNTLLHTEYVRVVDGTVVLSLVADLGRVWLSANTCHY
jgi:hypothetical protein